MSITKPPYRFRLPAAKPGLQHTFMALCVHYDGEGVRLLQEKLAVVRDRISDLTRPEKLAHQELIELLAQRSIDLLDTYDSYSGQKKRLIIGAVRYFLSHHDLSSDTRPLDGLDDDIAVMNYVLERIGLLEKIIPLW